MKMCGGATDRNGTSLFPLLEEAHMELGRGELMVLTTDKR